jgi:hypothetical protein
MDKRDKKDNKGRNNINKKDHQLKYTSLVDENTNNVENKILNEIQDKNQNQTQN